MSMSEQEVMTESKSGKLDMMFIIRAMRVFSRNIGDVDERTQSPTDLYNLYI